ncbi:zinc finger, CCHC-type containing protein [Tanacetum coccineum]
MNFLLSCMSAVYVLTTPMTEDGGDNPTVEQVRKRAKWDNDDYVCRGLILNGMSDSLFDIYQNVVSSKELWDSLEAKYMAEDASSKKFLVSNFTNYKMTDSRPVMEQYNELLGILGRFTQHKMNMDEAIQVSCSHLRIGESLDIADKDNQKVTMCWSLSLSITVEHNNSSSDLLEVWKPGHLKKDFKGVNVSSKANGSGTKGLVDGSSNSLKCQNMFNKSLQCVKIDVGFKTYKSLNDINSSHGTSQHFVHDKEEALDKFKVFKTKVELQQGSLIKRFRTDRGGTRDEISNQHSYSFNVEDDPKTFDEAMKSQNVAIWKEAINDEMDSIMGNNTWVLANLPPADKCVYSKFYKSGKGVIICLNVNDMLIFGADQVQVDLTKEFLSSRFFMKDIGEADVILGIRIKHESNRIAISQSHCIENVVSQLEYSRVIGCLMYVMTCTRPDIAFAVGKLSRYTSNPVIQDWQVIQRVLKYLKKSMNYKLTYTGYPSVLECYIDASWISNSKYNSSTSGWVFLLGRGAISWAFNKQTYITGLTMEYEFVALAAAGKEAEWLINLILEIPLWSKPIAPISICCDSAATLAKAYSQMYNRKSRHLGVRHSMIRELIMNGVISIEFVRSQQNLDDHLIKRPTRDLVINSAEGMGLKSN